MICEDCKHAGELFGSSARRLNGAADKVTEAVLRTVKTLHQICRTESKPRGCDCQHKIGMTRK